VSTLDAKNPVRTSVMALLTVFVLVTGCTSDDGGLLPVGDMRTETTFLELGTANNVEVNLEVGIGNLELTSDSPRLMDATFRYNVKQWKPRISYLEEGEVWNLTMRQPNSDKGVEEGAENDWEVNLGTYVPMAVNVDIGAGNGDIDIYDMNLVSLSVRTGSGNLDVDLSGPWSAHMIARIGTGVGDVDLVVPSETGVQITVEQGVGTVVAPGFTQQGANYKNDAFDTAEVVILIAVSLGTGNLVVLETP
jgi:hypothetical protein